MPKQSRRERIVQIGAWIVLVLALLPAITYVGHWPVGGEHLHADDQDTAVAEEHEAHCHGGVSRCAGSEAMVGSTWAGEESNLLSLNSPNIKVETRQWVVPAEGEPAVILQPPQTV